METLINRSAVIAQRSLLSTSKRTMHHMLLKSQQQHQVAHRVMHRQSLNLTKLALAQMNQRQSMIMQSSSMSQYNQRWFASTNEKTEQQAQEGKQAAPAEDKKTEQPKETKQDSKQGNDTKKKASQEDSSSSSSDEEGAGPNTLSKEDIKQIKNLIKEQETEIEKLKEQVKTLKDKYVYQVAENDNTIKRYKKEIDQTKDFAITKFAKDLLDVRDNLERASEHIKALKLDEINELDELKKHFAQVQLGMGMTSTVMDSTLKRFNVTQFDPKGEKFDPNIHEAIFTIPDPTKEPNTVGEVMQTGWKIGDRVLRAAKVGIIKK